MFGSPGISTKRWMASEGPDNSYWSHEFYETDLARGFVRGFCYEFSRGEGSAATAIEGVQSGRMPWGDAHHDAYRRLLRRSTGHGRDLRRSARAP